jgi:SAM-dependent methyltransferase
VDDPGSYVSQHVKGISTYVADEEIPPALLPDYLEAKDQIVEEHIEDDLESERITSLYLMNHYLKADQFSGEHGLINSLIKQYWDHGPISVIQSWMAKCAQPCGDVIELGCGSGGVLPALPGNVRFYLGIDSSFASIRMAREFGLGRVPQAEFLIPDDLLNGTLSRSISVNLRSIAPQSADYIVADALNPPVIQGSWDYALTLNMIDMVDDPRDFVGVQFSLLRDKGVAIQTGPYIWSRSVAQQVKEGLSVQTDESARAVEQLYQERGFTLLETKDQIPWLFYKHLRQLEIYLVHFIAAQK